MFRAGLAAHLRDGRAETLPEDADDDVALLHRQVLVDEPLRAFLIDTGTDVGLPAEHSELHVAFGLRVGVEGPATASATCSLSAATSPGKR